MGRMQRSWPQRDNRTPAQGSGQSMQPLWQNEIAAGGENTLPSEIERMLNRLFQREAGWSHPAAGSHEEVMDAILASLIRPSETVLVPVYGPRGQSIADLCERIGADPVMLMKEGDETFDMDSLEIELRRRRPAAVVVSHGEPRSSGCREMEEIGCLCQELDILFVADCGATFGTIPVMAEKWHLDAAVGAPILPACTPVTYSERALAKLLNRRNVEPPLLFYRDDWSKAGSDRDTAERQRLQELRARLEFMISKEEREWGPIGRPGNHISHINENE